MVTDSGSQKDVEFFVCCSSLSVEEVSGIVCKPSVTSSEDVDVSRKLGFKFCGAARYQTFFISRSSLWIGASIGWYCCQYSVT